MRRLAEVQRHLPGRSIRSRRRDQFGQQAVQIERDLDENAAAPGRPLGRHRIELLHGAPEERGDAPLELRVPVVLVQVGQEEVQALAHVLHVVQEDGVRCRAKRATPPQCRQDEPQGAGAGGVVA